MRKTTAKYSGSVFLWLLMVLPVALVLAIEKKHPDFEEQMDRYTSSGPLWKLAIFASDHPFSVIFPGALLVVLVISKWRRTAMTSLGLLTLAALVLTVASLVVAAKYGLHYGVLGLDRFWNIKLQWWLSGSPIVNW